MHLEASLPWSADVRSHRTFLHLCLASSHPQYSTGCSSNSGSTSSGSSSMRPEAGLGWAGEGGCRSYLGRIHSIWPSSGGVAGTFPPRYPGTAGTFVSARAGQISAVPARWTGWRRREAAPGHPRCPSLPTRDSRWPPCSHPSASPGSGYVY